MFPVGSQILSIYRGLILIGTIAQGGEGASAFSRGDLSEAAYSLNEYKDTWGFGNRKQLRGKVDTLSPIPHS